MNWSSATLGTLVEREEGLIQTGPFGSQLHQSDYVADGIPVIMPKDIIEGRIDEDSVARVSDETALRLSRHQLKPRAIVLPRRGEIAKRAFIRNGQAGWLCGSGCLQIVVYGRYLLPEFLYYYMEQEQVIRWLEQHAVGTTMLNLSGAIVYDLPVRYPALKLQQRIADTLYSYDELIENNSRRMALLEEAERQLYREWFVHLRFPGYEHAHIRHGTPEGWRKVALGEITQKIGSGFTPRGGEAAYLTDGTALIRSLNVYDDWFQENGLAFLGENDAEALAGVTVESRDILLNITGASVARCCMAPERHVPARVNQHVMIIRVDPEKASPFLVHRAINSDEKKRLLLSYAQKGSTREALTKEMISRFDITLPSDTLMTEFDEIVARCFRQREVLAHQNQKLRLARDLLLPRLMSGEISVSS